MGRWSPGRARIALIGARDPRTMAGMTYFDLEGFRMAGALSDPFPHLAMEDFLRPEHHAAIDRDFPTIGQAGSFDPSSLDMGRAMNEALEELRGEATAVAVAE